MSEYRHIGNLQGPQGRDATDIPGASISNPIYLDGSEDLDALEPSFYKIPSNSAAESLGLPGSSGGSLDVREIGATMRSQTFTTAYTGEVGGMQIYSRGTTNQGAYLVPWVKQYDSRTPPVGSQSITRIVTAPMEPEGTQDGDLVLLYEPKASHFTDFAEGSSDWTSQWDSGNTSIDAGEGELSGNTFSIWGNDGDQNGFSWQAVDEPGDVEISGRFKTSTPASLWTAGLIAGGNGSATEDTVVFLCFTHAGSGKQAQIYAGGTLVASTFFPEWEEGVWMRSKLQVNGTRVLGKVWLDSEPEPPWMMSADHPGAGIGWVGVGQRSSRRTWWDSFEARIPGGK